MITLFKTLINSKEWIQNRLLTPYSLLTLNLSDFPKLYLIFWNIFLVRDSLDIQCFPSRLDWSDIVYAFLIYLWRHGKKIWFFFEYCSHKSKQIMASSSLFCAHACFYMRRCKTQFIYFSYISGFIFLIFFGIKQYQFPHVILLSISLSSQYLWSSPIHFYLTFL